MGRMMIESLANGRDGCMHGCFGFTRIKERSMPVRFSGPVGDPNSNITHLGGFIPGRFRDQRGNPYGTVAMIGVFIPGRVLLEWWAL